MYPHAKHRASIAITLEADVTSLDYLTTSSSKAEMVLMPQVARGTAPMFVLLIEASGACECGTPLGRLDKRWAKWHNHHGLPTLAATRSATMNFTDYWHSPKLHRRLAMPVTSQRRPAAQQADPPGSSAGFLPLSGFSKFPQVLFPSRMGLLCTLIDLFGVLCFVLFFWGTSISGPPCHPSRN